MKLSIVILNYNVQYFLELCLRSVEAAILNLDAEIIVVDNNSSDGSCSMVKQLFPKVKLIENRENLGFSKGNNIGVEQAAGEYICILNPDTVVPENTFETMLKFADSQQNLGILGCKLIDGSGSFLPESKRNIPTPNVAFKKILGDDSMYYANHLKANDIGKVDVLVGAFMLIKQEVYNQVQGFDEDYFMYGKNIDLSYKVLKSGYHNYYFGNATVIHFKGESTLKDKTYAKRFYNAMQIFYKKHFRRSILFDMAVWLGTKLLSLLRRQQQTGALPKNYFYLGSNLTESIQQALKGRTVKTTDTVSYKDATEYIFDNNNLSFRDIVNYIEQRPKTSTATFKIIPKTATFMLGSNDSKNRGEIIHFNNN